jgi:hypothetical protein
MRLWVAGLWLGLAACRQTAPSLPASGPLLRAVDLDVGESAEVQRLELCAAAHVERSQY